MADRFDFENTRSLTPRMAGAMDVADFQGQARDPDSYISQALQIPALLAGMQSNAAAGNMTAAKGQFDQVDGFYSAHADGTARWAAVDDQRSPALRPAKQAALLGLQRGYASVKVNTPYGQMTAEQAFGSGGAYEKMQSLEVRRQADFSKDVSDALDAGDEFSSFLEKIVNPVLGALAQGRSVQYHGQYTGLAHQIARDRASFDELGVDAMNAVLRPILDSHMGDGTASTLYRMAVSALKERKAALGDDFDGASEARRFHESVGRLSRRVVKSENGLVSDDDFREVVSALAPAVMATPGIDLDDEPTANAVGDVADKLVRASRLGVPVASVVGNGGGDFSRAVSAYVTSRRTGVEPSGSNLVAGIGAVSDLILNGIVAAGWAPVKSGNDATGLGMSSGFRGLDSASAALCAPLLRGSLRKLVGGADAVSAVRETLQSVLSDEDSDDRRQIVDAVARGMRLSGPTADIVARAIARGSVTSEGIFTPVGIDQAVVSLITDPQAGRSASMAVALPELRRWYATNMGESGALYDKLLQGYDLLLNDPELSPLAGSRYPSDGARKAAWQTLYQDAKRTAYAALQNGGSPSAALDRFMRQGTYYTVVGWRDPKGNQRSLEELEQKLNSLKPERRRDELAKTVPVFGEVRGDLDAARQPVADWRIPGTGDLIPTYDTGSWSDRSRREAFRTANHLIRAFYQEQLKQRIKEAAASDASGIRGG